MLQSKDRVAECIQKQNPYICCQKETHFRLMTYTDKVRGWKKIFHANWNQKKASIATVTSHKIDFKDCWASLVAQWLRICLPMQGTRVRALIWDDPTCCRANGPVSHNYWACISGACAPQQEAATVRGPRTAMKSGPHLPQLEKALAQKQRPNTPKK